MTNEVRLKISKMLMHKRDLLGDGMLVPQVYVVNDHPYWFLNVARRAAYGTRFPIEVISIEAAFELVSGLPSSSLDRKHVDWHFDQKGDTFNGRLFDAGGSVLADMCNVPVFKDGKGDDKQLLKQNERVFLLMAMGKNDHDKERTAKYLSISPYTLEKRMKQYGITV